VNGLLIGIEGVDGSGKTVFAKALTDLLSGLGLRTVLTKEPGGTDFGKQLRKILQYRVEPISAKAEYLLFAADRAQHFTQVVIPSLQGGAIVVSDRTGDSSVAYQGYGRGLEIDMIKRVNQWATDSVSPDIIIYLKIDLTTAQTRIKQRNEQPTVFEQEHLDFTQRLLDGFDELYQNRPEVLILDGKLPTNELVTVAQQRIQILASKKGLI